MGSIITRQMRAKYPGRNDQEVAAAMAAESGDLVIVRYKNTSSSIDFDNFGCCPTSREVDGYFNSPHCHQTEIVFDNRAAARPKANPLRRKIVSVICYQLGSRSPPSDPGEYCRRIIAENYSGKVSLDNGCTCIGTAVPWDSEWALERAIYDYHNMVRREQIPDHGNVADLFQCTAHDGVRVVVLLFNSSRKAPFGWATFWRFL